MPLRASHAADEQVRRALARASLPSLDEFSGEQVRRALAARAGGTRDKREEKEEREAVADAAAVRAAIANDWLAAAAARAAGLEESRLEESPTRSSSPKPGSVSCCEPRVSPRDWVESDAGLRVVGWIAGTAGAAALVGIALRGSVARRTPRLGSPCQGSSKAVPRVAHLAATFGQRRQHFLGRRVWRVTDSPAPSAAMTLAAGAHVYLNFMSLAQQDASRWPGYQSDPRTYRLFAAARYARFRALQLQHPHKHLVPTRDISAAWAADLLRPTEYVHWDSGGEKWLFHQQHRLLQSGQLFAQHSHTEDTWSAPKAICAAGALGLFEMCLQPAVGSSFPCWLPFLGLPLGFRTNSTTGVDASPQTALGLSVSAFDQTGDGILTSKDRREALKRWKAGYDVTARIWKENFGEPFRLDDHELNNALSGTSAESFTEADHRLADAMASQEQFNSRILALGPQVVDGGYIAQAVQRYFDFLELARQQPGRLLVPTLDIDLVWHVHQLSPADYRDDCQELLGRPLSHDTSHGTQDLAAAFQQTQAAWEDTFDAPMLRPAAAPSRENKKSGRATNSSKLDDQKHTHAGGGYAGCGSCGFGDSHFHSTLGHQHVEAQMVQAADLRTASGPSDWANGTVQIDNFAVDVPGDDGGSVWTEIGAGVDVGGGGGDVGGGVGGDAGAGCGAGCGGGCGGGF